MSQKLLIIVVVLLVLIGSYVVKNIQTVSPESDNILACLDDSECIAVRADNCGCTAGGTATSINKNYVDLWEKDHPLQICPAVMSLDWTCSAIPQCLSNQCKLVKRN